MYQMVSERDILRNNCGQPWDLWIIKNDMGIEDNVGVAKTGRLACLCIWMIKCEAIENEKDQGKDKQCIEEDLSAKRVAKGWRNTFRRHDWRWIVSDANPHPRL